MTCGPGRMRDGFPSPFSRGQALRGNNGEREGFPPPVFTGAGSRREDNEGKGNCRNGGDVRQGGGGGPCPDARFLGCARHEEWEVGKEDGDGFPSPFHGGRLFAGIMGGGMGSRPPSSRGQDLDARTTRGRAARFLDCARNDMWVVGRVSRPRVWGSGSARGQRGEGQL